MGLAHVDPLLARPVGVLPGVGPERTALLARLHLFLVEDLLLHRPRRYEDRRHVRPIAGLPIGEPVTARGRIVAQGVKRLRNPGQSVFEFVLEDDSGRLQCRWWNLPFMARQFEVGDQVMVHGRVLRGRGHFMDHPETERIETGEEQTVHLDRIVPIYPLTEGISQRWLRGLIFRTLAGWPGLLPDPWPGIELDGLPSRHEAIQQIHFPFELADASRARARLALDEFVELQLAIQRRRRALESHSAGLPCAGDNRHMKPFLRQLGFSLTGAQTQVLRELRADLGGRHPMRRLVQGDVGSGKTVVAACAALMALESGFNAAVMAPTEILADQHFQVFRRWFEPLGLAVELRTGEKKAGPPPRKGRSLAPAEGQERNSETGVESKGSGTLFVGTHALLTSTFGMPRLGLVIVDEQHKFGVVQREQLVRKGRYPHLLVMTATPIPRTLGLTLYGDLDLSTLSESPGGRGRVRTFIRTPAQLARVYEFVRHSVTQGRQAYLVFPRVDEVDGEPALAGTARAGLKAVTREFEKLSALFAPLGVGLMHGRLRPEAKEAVMAAFRRNELQILIATSVIEVGVDVPNAAVMVIDNAERFGLAQLHQLRGRIGRGAHASHCILVSDAKSPAARERLEVLAGTQDGFEIAEADLRLRGPGELLGAVQSGTPALRFGDLATDLALIQHARSVAARLLGG